MNIIALVILCAVVALAVHKPAPTFAPRHHIYWCHITACVVFKSERQCQTRAAACSEFPNITKSV
jgi:hypothetical protein